MTHGEALARQIEAEQYDLAALEAEALLPVPMPREARDAWGGELREGDR